MKRQALPPTRGSGSARPASGPAAYASLDRYCKVRPSITAQDRLAFTVACRLTVDQVGALPARASIDHDQGVSTLLSPSPAARFQRPLIRFAG